MATSIQNTPAQAPVIPTSPDALPSTTAAPASAAPAPAAAYEGATGTSSLGAGAPPPGLVFSTGQESYDSLVPSSFEGVDTSALTNLAEQVKAKAKGLQDQLESIGHQIKTRQDARQEAMGKRDALQSKLAGLDPDADDYKKKKADLESEIANVELVITTYSDSISSLRQQLDGVRDELEKVIDKGRDDARRLVDEIERREAQKNKQSKPGADDSKSLSQAKEIATDALKKLDVLKNYTPPPEITFDYSKPSPVSPASAKIH